MEKKCKKEIQIIKMNEKLYGLMLVDAKFNLTVLWNGDGLELCFVCVCVYVFEGIRYVPPTCMKA